MSLFASNYKIKSKKYFCRIICSAIIICCCWQMYFSILQSLELQLKLLIDQKWSKVKLRSVRSLPLKSIFVRSICYEASLTHNPIEKEYNKKKAEFTFTFSLSLN